MGRIVGIVEEAPRGDDEIVDEQVLGTDAEDQRILDHAAAKADAVVHVHYRRGVHDAGQLGVHGLFVFAGEEVGVAHALGVGCAAADVLHLHRVGAEFLNQLQNILPAGHADGDHQDYRGGSDHHAQRGERKPRLRGAETVHGQLENLA